MRDSRFSAKFLQPRTLRAGDGKPQPLLKEIHPGYIDPNGRMEGEDDEIAKAIEHADASTGKG